MAVTPLPGTEPGSLLNTLQQVSNDLNHARLMTGATRDRVIAYSRWVMNSTSALRRMIRSEDLENLILTRRQWALQSIDPSGLPEMINPLLNLEFEERAAAFELAVSEQQEAIARWSPRSSFIVVADTNVFAEHDESIEDYGWREIVDAGRHEVNLVVPMLVIDELDRLKRDKRVKSRARATLRSLEDLLLRNPLGRVTLTPAADIRGRVTVELLVDPPYHVRLPDPDDELVDRAAVLATAAGRDVHFVTGDHAALFRSSIRGLSFHHLPVPEHD